MAGSDPPPSLPPCPSTATQRLGTTIDNKYRLRSLIGVGGMGLVYEAEHLFLGREVAVKVLHPRYADTHEWSSRFLREARAAGALTHRAVVQVVDAGFLDGTTPYLVMERLRGENLAERIVRRGGLRVEQVVVVVREVLRGLTAAHAKGIVHCDLKPANVFVVDRRVEPGHVKILDFGISKTGHDALHAQDTDQVLGTPQYMAPEQVLGHEVTARTDLHGVGLIAYEALSASLPFAHPRKSGLFRRIVGDPLPPLEGKRGPVPAGLTALVEQLLARSPSGRPASAAEALARLEGLGLFAPRDTL